MQNGILVRSNLWLAIVVCCLSGIYTRAVAATTSRNAPVVAKWGRFEHTFKSVVVYSNPLQDTTLTVLFTSPLGETNQVEGFWDGGKTWRVRFSPNQPGRWTFRTSCSDTTNKGLHDQTGEFICTAITGRSRFNVHGPVRAGRDHRHLEHADGTPFFWLADTTWEGARVANPKDWELYARVRARQKFTAVLWALAPGNDARRESAFSGNERIVINPQFFKRLDAKLETLSRAGLLNVIAPVAEMNGDARTALPDDQAALLTRYAIARWGSEPVVWLLEMGGADTAKKADRWKRIGRSVFSIGQRRPVMAYTSDIQLLEQFGQQDWVDLLGAHSISDFTDEAWKQAFAGPLSKLWTKEAGRPMIWFVPHENALGPQSKKRFSADEVRKAVWSSLFLAPPAGVTYGAQGVSDWDNALEPKREKKEASLPLWHKSLFLPAAKQMAPLASFVNSNQFWRLRPEPRFVANQPGEQAPRRWIGAAGTEAKDFAAVYLPEDRTLEITLEALPQAPVVSWLNPRTGENNPAVAVVGGRTCQFPTPDPGDWLLIMRAGK